MPMNTNELAAIPEKVEAHFWANAVVCGPDECWPWTGRIGGRGYGSICNGGSSLVAHRVAVVLDGRPIPQGMVVDHMCSNRLCVNPAHLRIVTNRTNIIENSTSVSAINAAKTHCAGGHKYTPENIYIRHRRDGSKSRVCRICAREYAIAYYYKCRRPAHLQALEGDNQ